MKRLSLLLTLLLTVENSAADDEKGIQQIRERYEQVQGSLKRCKVVTREIEGESTEGGELKAWLLDGAIVKMDATHYGEGGRKTQEFYLQDAATVFAFEVTARYDKPLSGKIVSREEERFYFTGSKLLRWLDAKKKPLDVTTQEASKKAAELLEDAARFARLAGSK